MRWRDHDLGENVDARSSEVGFAAANCYIIADSETRAAAVVDPGTGDPEELKGIVDEIGRMRADVRYILNTHGHPDHMWGNDYLKREVGGDVVIHELDGLKLTDPERNSSVLFGFSVRVSPADRLVREDDTIDLGEASLRVLHTPGHSTGGVAFLGDGFVLTGDTLFAGSIGRSDLPCSSEESTVAYQVLIDSIGEKLLSLPDETVVLPGHGPVTTIGRERETNPFLR
ncbi:MAG: MBL fold metallo-hydrolase [Candidatus Eisenbacteria bacterium]|nr:MBL fold metallo-hydrolase [Candidatus Eisenbacteria bacterium]